MKNPRLDQILLSAATLCGSMFMILYDAALASTWTGPSAMWSNTGSWMTTVPSAVGDVADFDTAPTANVTTTIAAGSPVTVGAINYGNSSVIGDFSWLITNTGGLTLNQDSGGAGFATLTNSNQTSGANNTLAISTGTLTLADNLKILVTTTDSQFINGAVSISSVIAGTGNVALNSSQPIDPGMSDTSTWGAIKLSAANTFVGNTTIEQGLVAFSNVVAFGPSASNTIFLGVGNANNVALVRTNASAALTVANPITVAGSQTGTVTLGAFHNTGSVTTTFTGNFTLGSTLTVSGLGNVNTRAVNLTGTISGSGGITKVGAGFVQIIPASLNNTYSGDTVVNEGSLVVAGTNGVPDGPGKGNVIVGPSGIFVTGANETINGLSGSGIVTTGSGSSRTLTMGGNDVTSAFTGTMQNNGARVFTLRKSGTGTFTHTGTSTYSGSSTVEAGTFNFTGNHTGAGGYSVLVDGTLAGIGSISSTISLTGKLSPGNAVDMNTVGTFTAGGLTFQSGSRGVFELKPGDTTVGSGINDYVDVVGAITAADLTTINIDIQAIGGGSLSGIGTWTLASYDTLAVTGTQTFNVTGVTGGYTIGFVPDDNMNQAGPGALKLTLGVTLPGDFNSDGKVNAADYVLWRKNPSGFLPSTYDTWRANFGNPPGSGSGLGVASAVPEPSTLGAMVAALLGSCVGGRKSRLRRD